MIESTLTSSTAAGFTAFLFTLVYAIDGDPETGDPALEIRKRRKEEVLFYLHFLTALKMLNLRDANVIICTNLQRV